jgi:protein TonB
MMNIPRRIPAILTLAIALLGATSILAADAATPAQVDQSKPTPVIYPMGAQTLGEQGSVIVNVLITQGGKPLKVALARSSGYDDLDNAALETVLNWHYLPAVRDGDTVSDWTQVNVVYKLPN